MSANHKSINQTAEILIVDDELANLQLLTEFLSNAGYSVRPSRESQLAIESARVQQPDLILLDVKMPGMDGFEVCRRLKQDEQTRDIPILFVGALTELRDRVRCFEVGGVDFIFKPFQEPEVLTRVRSNLALHGMQAKLEDFLSKRSAELVENQASFQEIQSKAKIGSWCVEVESEKITWSPMLYEIMGLDPNKPPPFFAEFQAYFTAESWERLTQTVKKSLNDGEPYHLDLNIVRPDGSVRHTFVSGNMVQDDAGRINRIIGTTQDITERKHNQQRLRASEKNYRTLVDTAIVGIFYTKATGQFEFVNDALVKMFEFSNQKEMISQGDVARWNNLAHRERFLAIMRSSGEVRNFETKAVTAKGRKIDIQFSATLYGGKIRGMVVDISAQKKAEKDCNKHRQRLRAMASELIFTEERERQQISNELHDQVAQTLALARIQLAEATETAAGPAGAMLGEVSQYIRQALKQVRNILLDLHSPTLHQMGLCAGVSELLETNIRDRHGLKTVFQDSCGDVYMPDEMSILMFRNVRELLTNVVKYGQAHEVTVKIAVVGQLLQIIVEDDGVGFDPDNLKSLPNRNAGFGLFSIAERMTDLEGSLKILSSPGEGCRITLLAPLVPAMKGGLE